MYQRFSPWSSLALPPSPGQLGGKVGGKLQQFGCMLRMLGARAKARRGANLVALGKASLITLRDARRPGRNLSNKKALREGAAFGP